MAHVSETEVNAERKRAEDWQKRFSDFERDREIAEASVRHGAKNVAQIRDLIGHRVVLAEQAGGDFASVIETDGKMVPVDEFVAALSKVPEHANLFNGKMATSAVSDEPPGETSFGAATSLQRIRRGLKQLGTAHTRDTATAPAGTPTDAPARKIARGLRGLK